MCVSGLARSDEELLGNEGRKAGRKKGKKEGEKGRKEQLEGAAASPAGRGGT